MESREVTACTEVAAGPRRHQWKRVVVNWQPYAQALLPITWLVIFLYVPMYGNGRGTRKSEHSGRCPVGYLVRWECAVRGRMFL
jgi:hypothetical protein